MADVNPMLKVYNEPISIKLPESMEFIANLNSGKRFAIDIGCSLTKIAYYSATIHRQSYWKKKNSSKLKTASSSVESKNEEFLDLIKHKENKLECSNSCKSLISEHYDDDCKDNNIELTSQFCSQRNCEIQQMSRLHFAKFQTKYLEKCLDFIENHIIGRKELLKGNIIKVTGSGVCKYAACIKEKLGVLIDKEDEINCLTKGTNFLLKNVAREAFTYQRNRNPEYVFQNVDSDLHPYLLVNIGSGVSIIKVTGEECYEKIGGLTTGGATFWGLGSLLTSAKEYDELLELAENGDCRKVDMLVKDIFGNDSNSTGLPGDLIAASFGKINYSYGEAAQKKFSEADIAKSLLFTILNGIGQVASLYAMIHKVTNVYFGGYFLRNNPLNMDVLSRAVNYWSDNKIKALYLLHEGYLGTIGAFLKGTEIWEKESVRQYSNGSYNHISQNNFTNSLQDHNTFREIKGKQFSSCPLLLNPESYSPDVVDLIKDAEARDYWLVCFEDTLAKLKKKAEESQKDDATAAKRAKIFQEKFLQRLHYLKTNPTAYGALSVRTLLDSMHKFLHEYNFPDPYLRQKELENRKALSLFPQHIKYLDQLNTETRHQKLISYVLAGNMFDWGAKEVSALLENNNFGFAEALTKIPERPWLVDSLDDWIERLKGPAHKCAVIFVDNSGLDIILGILPFVRELLRRGTEVILCSNSSPALNDVTHTELLNILEKVKPHCSIIKKAVQRGQLVPMETGQTGPCLDLSHLDKKLCDTMTNKNVDLIVLEGMGRSVHTNLNASFKCESLKVAVIKNRWLAHRLGGDMFCVICQYQKKPAS